MTFSNPKIKSSSERKGKPEIKSQEKDKPQLTHLFLIISKAKFTWLISQRRSKDFNTLSLQH